MMEPLASVPDTDSASPEAVPAHVAIIMDGNGRWAKARGLPRTEGHRRGVEAVRRVVESAQQLGISYLTLYGFSSENWNRPQAEVRDLMGILRFYLRKEIAALHRNGVRIRFIGDRSRFSDDIVDLFEASEEKTKANVGLTLVIALSYGGRDEILHAARTAMQAAQSGQMSEQDMTEERFAKLLFTDGIPDPDLIIRTSGEQRLSNFMLWQCAYAELIFTKCLWPDFGFDELREAMTEFQRRERRYGAAIG